MVFLIDEIIFVDFENTYSVVSCSCSNQFWATIFRLKFTPRYRINGSHMVIWYDAFIQAVCLTDNVPNRPAFVFGAWSHEFSRLIKIYLPDCRLMTIHGVWAKPVINWVIIFPTFYGIVVTCWEQEVLCRMPFNKFNVLGVSTQNSIYWKLEFLIGILILKHFLTLCFIYVNRFISATGCQELSRIISSLRPCKAFNFILMILKLLNACKVQFSLFNLFSPYAASPVKWGTC